MTVEDPLKGEVSISIAEIPVRLLLDDDEMVERVRRHYAAFLDPTGQAPAVTLTVQVRPGARFVPIEPGPWVMNVTHHAGRIMFESYLEAGEADLNKGSGQVVMAPEGSLENFLRVVYAWLCLRGGGLLLHAAGVIRDGCGYAFFGPSGAGKTTTTRLSQDVAQVLSDDLVIIRRRDGRYVLCGVPFRGEMVEAPRLNAQAPLIGLYRLRKDQRHAVEPLSMAEGVAELVAAAPFVVADRAAAAELMNVCSALMAAVPVRALHFRRDDGFWRVIRGHPAETLGEDQTNHAAA
jgi:hypothetical protein